MFIDIRIREETVHAWRATVYSAMLIRLIRDNKEKVHTWRGRTSHRW